MTSSALESLDQNSANEGSLTRCQTADSGAEMRADSETDVEVGMRDAILRVWKDLESEMVGCGVVVKRLDLGGWGRETKRDDYLKFVPLSIAPACIELKPLGIGDVIVNCT